jgi:acyl carrier protein
MKTFETLNIDSFDALQFIVALDEKLELKYRNRIMENQYDEITSFLYQE